MTDSSNSKVFTGNSQEYTDAYKATWAELRPGMDEFLHRLNTLMQQTGSGVGEPVFNEGGDEEFKLSVDWSTLGSNDTVGVDIVLTDALVRGEDEGAFGLLVQLVKGAQTIGYFAPGNYTAQAFTQDVDELKSRLADLEDNATEFVDELVAAMQKPAALPRPGA